MKKLLFSILIVLPILGFAELDVTKVTKVLLSLEQNRPLKYFNENINFKKKFKQKGSSLRFTALAEADIVLMSNIKDSSKLIITDSYAKLKNSNRSVIGAVYTKKERTHIFLVRERLKEKGLHISKKMKKYLISECYLNMLCLAL